MRSKAKHHTPGPWHCGDTLTNGKMSVYGAEFGDIADGDEVAICDVTNEDCGNKEALGNALLIALAPELLQSWLQMFDKLPAGNDEVRATARFLLHRLEGRGTICGLPIEQIDVDGE